MTYVPLMALAFAFCHDSHRRVSGIIGDDDVLNGFGSAGSEYDIRTVSDIEL